MYFNLMEQLEKFHTVRMPIGGQILKYWTKSSGWQPTQLHVHWKVRKYFISSNSAKK